MSGLFTGILIALGLGAVAWAAIKLGRSAETGTRGINALGDRVARDGLLGTLLPQARDRLLPATNTGIVPPNLQGTGPAYENPALWGSLTKDLATAGKTIADIFRTAPEFGTGRGEVEQIELVEVGSANRDEYIKQLDTGPYYERQPD